MNTIVYSMNGAQVTDLYDEEKKLTRRTTRNPAHTYQVETIYSPTTGAPLFYEYVALPELCHPQTKQEHAQFRAAIKAARAAAHEYAQSIGSDRAPAMLGYGASVCLLPLPDCNCER